MKHKEKDWLAWLEKEGLNIAGYIDHDSHKSWYEDKPVFGIEEIPARTFIIFFMEQFDPGDIPGLLTEKGLEEGTDFITMG